MFVLDGHRDASRRSKASVAMVELTVRDGWQKKKEWLVGEYLF